MGAAFITRRGGGGNVSPRFERLAGVGNNEYQEWNNLAVSTNTYFLRAETGNMDDGDTEGYLEAIIDGGSLEVLFGYTSGFSISITQTSIKVSKVYSNTYLDGWNTILYRFC